MTSKPRKPIDPMNDERVARGSVFDRLGAKQTISQQHQQNYHQIRSSSNKMQSSSSKYDNTDARRKLDSSMHSSHPRNFNNQFTQDSNQQQQPSDIYFNKTNRNSGNKQMLKSKINKLDDFNHQFKK